MRSIYDEVKNHFREHSMVEIAEGKGAQGLKVNGKMFVMFYKGDITVKLTPAHVKQYIESGKGLPHDPGTGKPMKDRLVIPASKQDCWMSMCEVSLQDALSC
jgi:hypothetical protein